MIDALENNLSSWQLGLLLIGGTIALTVAALLVARRWVKAVTSGEHNEIVGFIFATAGVIYAVLLAFVVFGVWENYTTAERAAAQESATLIALYRDAVAFPPNTRVPTENEIRAYTTAVLDDEWATMKHGNPSPQAQADFRALFTKFGAFRPTTPWQVAVYQESFGRLNDLSQSRSLRLVSSKAALPVIFWIMLIFGAVVTLAFAVLLYLENTRTHALLAALLAAVIGSALFLIIALDRPFGGDIHVPKDSFEYALQVLGSHVTSAVRR